MKTIFLFFGIAILSLNLYGERRSLYEKPREDFSTYDKKYSVRSYPLAYMISRSELIILGKVDDKKREGDVNVVIEKIIASVYTKQELKAKKMMKGSHISVFTKPFRCTIHFPNDPLLFNGGEHLFFLGEKAGTLKLVGGWQGALSFSAMDDLTDKDFVKCFKNKGATLFERDKRYLKDLYDITDSKEWLKAIEILTKAADNRKELEKFSQSKEKVYSETANLLLKQKELKTFKYFGD